MKCKKCLCEITESQIGEFCIHCGTKLTKENIIEDKVEQAQPKSKTPYIIAALVAGLLLGFGGFFLLNKDKPEETEKEPTEEVATTPEEDEEDDVIVSGADVVVPTTPMFNETFISNVSATSSLSENNMTHSVERIYDNNTDTAWVEGAPGHGIGESVTFQFSQDVIVSGMDICAGYQKNHDLWINNSRPHQITVSFSDGTSQTIQLQESQSNQEIKFDTQHTTSYVKVTIDTVYPGSKYEDTCISELHFN